MRTMAGLVFVSAGLAASTVLATPVVFSSVGSTNRAAEVSFDIVGNQLVIKLTNTSDKDVLVPSNVLTGVFFDLTGPTANFSKISAKLAPGSFVTANGATEGVDGVGGEWAYKGGLNVNGMEYGISSSGLGIFGSNNCFTNVNLSGPASPDGLQYGITSAGDDVNTGNGGVLGTPLIKNSVVFVLGNLPSGFSLEQIGKVYMQYGTKLDEPRDEGFPKIPTPGAVALLGLGGMVTLRGRRRGR